MQDECNGLYKSSHCVQCIVSSIVSSILLAVLNSPLFQGQGQTSPPETFPKFLQTSKISLSFKFLQILQLIRTY